MDDKIGSVESKLAGRQLTAWSFQRELEMVDDYLDLLAVLRRRALEQPSPLPLST